VESNDFSDTVANVLHDCLAMHTCRDDQKHCLAVNVLSKAGMHDFSPCRALSYH
jgi:hypothetical protein